MITLEKDEHLLVAEFTDTENERKLNDFLVEIGNKVVDVNSFLDPIGDVYYTVIYKV